MSIVVLVDLIPHDPSEPDGPAPEGVDILNFFEADHRYAGADCYGIVVMDAGRVPPRILMAGDQIAVGLTAKQIAELRYHNAREDEQFAKSQVRSAELDLDSARNLYRTLSWERAGERAPAWVIAKYRQKVNEAYLRYDDALALVEDARYARDRRVEQYTQQIQEAQSCPP